MCFVRRHDERVSPLVREVVVLLEHGKFDGAKVLSDLGEREPADLDEAEERLGREQAVVPVWVAHVPVGRDERWHGSEHLGDLARVAHQLIRNLRAGVGSTMERYVAIFVRTGEMVR